MRLQGHDAKRSGPLEIIAELGGVQRNVIIDTGAEVNVIARDFVWQNSWKKNIKEQKEEILGIANQVIETDGTLVLDESIKRATVPVKKQPFKKLLKEGGIRLAYPLPDREFLIRTDASDAEIGTALLQRNPEGDELPIMYAHRVFHGAEPYYSTTEKEGVAVLEAIKKWFPQYVWGEKFKVYTDHAALLSAFKNRELDGPRLGKWINKLTEFDFDLVHTPGKDNELADILSRCPKKVSLVKSLLTKLSIEEKENDQDGPGVILNEIAETYPELVKFLEESA